MANQKEVHFFDDDRYFAGNNPDYSRYHSYFSPKKMHKVLGETTPIYMYWNDAPQRIFRYNPEMKIIVILRNPIERAYSHWNMERSRNAERLTFIDAISTEQQRCREAHPYQHRVFSYIDRGRYLEQLRRLWEYFPKDRVLTIKTESLKQDPSATLDSVTHFLGVSKFPSIKDKNEHSLAYASSMSKEDRGYLKLIFDNEIKELEKALQWDCSDWLK